MARASLNGAFVMSTQTANKVSMWRRIRLSLIVLLSVVFITLAAAVGLLNSEVGTSWLVSNANKVPGLKIDNVEGTLFSKLAISSLTYSSESMEINVNNLAIGIELSCFWEKAVCLNVVRLDSIRVRETAIQTDAVAENTDSKMNLPIQISLPQMTLDTFIFERLDESQLQLEGLKIAPIVISATDKTHLLNLTDIDVQLESLFMLLPSSATHPGGTTGGNRKQNTHSASSVSHTKGVKGSDTAANLEEALATKETKGFMDSAGSEGDAGSEGSAGSAGSTGHTLPVDLTSDIKEIISHIQHSQNDIYAHINQLFSLQKDYRDTLQNIKLPKLEIPVNSVNASISVASINVLQHERPPLVENLSVKLNTQLKQTEPGQTQFLIEAFTGQHADFAWTITGAINETYAHDLAIDFQWFKPELVATELVSPIEHLVWRSSGYVLNPEIDISTTGLINANVTMQSDLRKADTPLDIQIDWAPVKYSYQDIHIEVGEGFLRANTDANTINVAFDIPVKTFVLDDRQPRVVTPKLQVSDIFSRCSIQVDLGKIKSQDCSINFAGNPYEIAISGTSEQGLNIATAFQFQNMALLSEWFVNHKKVSELLAENAITINHNSALAISTQTLIHKDKLHLESAVTVDGLVVNNVSVNGFNTAVELSTDNTGIKAQLAKTLVQLSLPKAQLHIKVAPSQFALDYAQGLIQTSAVDVALFNSTSDIKTLDINAAEINASNTNPATREVPLGNLRIAPMTVDSSAPELATELRVIELNLQNVLDVIQGVTPSPILANLHTTSAMTLTLNTRFTQQKEFAAELTANLSESTWEYDSLNIDLSPAELKGELAWDTTQPISTLTGNMQTEVSGSQLGKIALEIERTEKTKLYAELFSVNLGVFAPFVPQFKNFAGLASANLAMEQNKSDIDIAGVVIIPELAINIEKLPKSAQTPHPDIQFTKPLEHVFDSKIEESEHLNISSNINVFIDPLQQNTVTISALDFASALNGYVNVSGKIQSPLVMGEINIVDGSYAAYGQDLLIRSGSLNFTGPVSLPYIDIEAIRNPKNMADATIAGLQITGNPNQLKASLFSEPMLENPNILSYLIRGKGLDASSDEDNSVILTNALLGFGLGRSEDTVSKIGDAFGVDDLQLGTQGQGEQTQIGVSGKLNDRLSIEYRVGVFSAITEFGLRYQWLPNLYLEATSGASNALDIFYEIKWGERQLPNTEKVSPNTEQSSK